MARKPGQTTRSKRPSKRLRAVSRTAVDRPAMQPADPTAMERDRQPERARSDGTDTAPKLARPYQHRKPPATARLSVAPPASISKEQEYAFIREDLRRLLVTAGILIVVMIVLLLAIDR